MGYVRKFDGKQKTKKKVELSPLEGRIPSDNDSFTTAQAKSPLARELFVTSSPNYKKRLSKIQDLR